jgi:tetratricopeptide (TPR) repeat protein
VYVARELKHDRDVVLKILHPDVAAHVGMRRFLGEVRIAAQLSHPHVLPLIDSGEANGLLYYVMPRIEGETLRTRLTTRGRMPVREAIGLLRDIADALSAAHAHGIIHRDLKPENVLCAGSHAYLLDFGIARREAAHEDARHTQEGMVVGTLGYMSPEQSAGEVLDARSDVFAWGVIAREMLTGASPLQKNRTLDGVPFQLARLISQTLEDRREHRPASAQEIVQRLDAMTRVSSRVARVGRVRAFQGATIAAVAVAALWALFQWPPWGGGGEELPQPIAVGPLSNETGDTSLAIWGRMAGDWMTQGLHETSLVRVVPWSSVRHAHDELAQASPGVAIAPAALANEVGAGTIVTGSYYLAGNDVGFRLDVTDSRRNRLIKSLPAITVPRESLHVAVREARDRLMGWTALQLDERAASLPGIAEHPPTFDAYRAFDRGLASYNRQEYGPAAAEFRYAWNADTTFVPALIYAAMSHWNRDELAWVDTLVGMAAARRDQLNTYDQLQVEYLAALLASDGEKAVNAGRRAVAIAPESRVAYNLGRDLIAMDRAAEGRAVLEAIRPDRGLMKGWQSYWTQLAHARHLTGAHEEELQAARSMRRAFPEARVGTVLEARALAVLGRAKELDSLLTATAALPARTYWSHGAALVVSGEEMLAHGDTVSGRRNLERAVEWLRGELRAEPGTREHRYWLGSALYNLARWREAAAVFAQLHKDFPDRPQYQGLDALGRARLGEHAKALKILGDPPPSARGEHTTFRARLAGIAGDTAAARALRLQALREVSEGYAWLHATGFRDLPK